MRVFVTGATGYIGYALVQELVAAGHEVIGLTRTEAGAEFLKAAGAQAHRGTIDDLDGLRRGAAGAHGVIQLAYFHALTDMPISTRLRMLFGGSPTGIVARFGAVGAAADKRAIETLADALAERDRALVVAFPTLAMTPGHLATEDDVADPSAPGGPRASSEKATLALASRGIRASVVRLPPIVHGEGGNSGMLRRLSTIARKKGASAYVGDGHNRWPAVHRLDAARLFRLALEQGEGGARYHAVAEEGVPFLDIASVIGRRLNVPVVSESSREAARHFSWMERFVGSDNPTSNRPDTRTVGMAPNARGADA